ncbi:hypothetical protein Tsubulata_015031 [Turnera subulata]|uniref:Uncharacterized protein n=1 Tax=Turnera subulata TaxID=218843 RepID=A0A9Q0J054_9ROSI|nr:hypothetical protein Tsubulata_015031 [Turnera subulata]
MLSPPSIVIVFCPLSLGKECTLAGLFFAHQPSHQDKCRVARAEKELLSHLHFQFLNQQSSDSGPIYPLQFNASKLGKRQFEKDVVDEDIVHDEQSVCVARRKVDKGKAPSAPVVLEDAVVGESEIDDVVDGCSSLQYLDLSSNYFSGGIWNGFSRLKEFSVSENYLSMLFSALESPRLAISRS